MTFRGEFKHSLDSKSRIILPIKFREGLGETFIITRGLDACLFAFDNKTFEALNDKMKALPLTDEGVRKFERFFFGAATDCSFDSQGRVVVPQHLVEYAGITKDITSMGLPGRIEIWAREKWDKYNSMDNYIDKELAEKMTMLGI
jgi:MraZ protein